MRELPSQRRNRLVAVAAVAAAVLACREADPDPGRGEPVAVLATDGALLRLEDVAGALHAVYLDESSGAPSMVVARVSGDTPVALPTDAAVDWSDYALTSLKRYHAAETVRVADGRAWFLGFSGVTVVPLDGTPSYQLFQWKDGGVPGDYANNILSAFTVDQASVYVCYRGGGAAFGLDSATLARIAPDGTWEVLFPGEFDEDCYGGAVVADDAYVYWTSKRAIRALRKSDGQVSELVDLRDARLLAAPWQLAVTPTALVWLDQRGIHAAPRTGPTIAGAASLLVPFAPTDRWVFSLMVADGFVYWLDQVAVQRISLAGGYARLVAHRAPPPGMFAGLAASGGRVYFSDSVPDAGLRHYQLELLAAPR